MESSPIPPLSKIFKSPTWFHTALVPLLEEHQCVRSLCTCVWGREREREPREEVWCCNHLDSMVYISACGNTNEWDKDWEICRSLRWVFFFARPPPLTSNLPWRIVNLRGSQAWWITCLTVCISLSWCGAVIDFSWVSQCYRGWQTRVCVCVCVHMCWRS